MTIPDFFKERSEFLDGFLWEARFHKRVFEFSSGQ
jgi:hypothetical protein